MNLADYHPIIKTVHVSAVVVSYTLFTVRGIWMMRQSTYLSSLWVKILPHVNDTLLLASAITLTFGIEQYPGSHGWLTAKVVGLLLYILLGMAALRWAATVYTRIVFWVLAQLVFFYIVLVAINRDPMPIF